MIRDFLADADIIQLHSGRYCEFRALANFELPQFLMCYKHKFDAVKFDNERMKFVMIKL